MKSIILAIFVLVISGCASLDTTPLITEIKPTERPRDVQLKGLNISVADSSLTHDVKNKKVEKHTGPISIGHSVRNHLKFLNVNPAWNSGIVNALNKANIFSNNSTRIIYINATLLNFVLQSKAECLFQANYQLIDYNTDELLVEFDIESIGTMKDPWSHPATNWTEQAVKQALLSNIEQLIDKLNQLDDKILPIRR
ncbi:MAG: hypothetical protein V2B20_00470 [Pseudomonadota bacterium]